MKIPEARLRLALGEVAALDLEGLVPAARYRAPSLLQGAVGRAALLRAPVRGAEQISELLFGEAFEAIAEADGFLFGRCARDGYVGWAANAALSPASGPPTHRVAALATLVFESASIKSPLQLRLPMNALVRVDAEEGALFRLETGGWVPSRHLADLSRAASAFEARPHDAASRHLGAPYLWGGRTADGLDCSGLVQAAFFACGLACPRDSDQQQVLGSPIATGAEARAGDLVFWRGHVGMMLDETRLIHANAHAMSVAVEDLGAAAARIEAAGGGAAAVRRPGA